MVFFVLFASSAKRERRDKSKTPVVPEDISTDRKFYTAIIESPALAGCQRMMTYSFRLRIRVLPTVYPESCLGLSHTRGGRARVFSQIRFLQASYLQHDHRLPFLVRISSLVDFVPVSALTYYLHLASEIERWGIRGRRGKKGGGENRFRYSTSRYNNRIGGIDVPNRKRRKS